MTIQGIIKPPPEIRAVADKTALFVAKNGRAFEFRILNSDKGKTPKFSFLHESSPFHAYYEDRITFYENGGVDEPLPSTAAVKEDGKGEEKSMTTVNTNASSGNEGGPSVPNVTGVVAQASIATRKSKSSVDPIARALLAQRARFTRLSDARSTETKEDDMVGTHHGERRQGDSYYDSDAVMQPVAPRGDKYIETHVPTSLTPAQLEVIKLTAQFTALSGKGGSFLRDLTIREWSNYGMFGFLQPRHEHFAYFSSLVDAYRRILAGNVLTYEKEFSTIDGGLTILERQKFSQMVGLDTASYEDNTSPTNAPSLKLEIIHDLEQIGAMAGNVTKCLEDVAYRLEYERYMVEKKQEEDTGENDTGGGRLRGGTSHIDWYDFVVVETIDFPVHEIVEKLPPPPPLALPPIQPKIQKNKYEQQQMYHHEGSSMSEDDDNDADNDEHIKIVPEYTPKVVSTQSALNLSSRTHVIDPITKRMISIQDTSEHMRIQLLDPKWAEEKKKFIEKQKESNFVEGDAIARNINTFAKAVFGSSTAESASISEEVSGKSMEGDRIVTVGLQSSNSVSATSNQGNILGVVGPSIPFAPPTYPVLLPLLSSSQPNDSISSLAHMKPSLSEPLLKRARLNVNEDAAAPNTVAPGLLTPDPSITTLPIQSSSIANDVEKETTESEEVAAQSTVSEMDFAKSLDDPNIILRIAIPLDVSNKSWNLNGQVISITVNVMTKIKAIKEKIQSQLGGMPVNKMQLRCPNGFLKDATSLAYCNIGPHNAQIELVPKTRGGRK